MFVCLKVLLRVSVHVAISLYSVVAIAAGVMSFLLPIETKGREMAVSLAHKLFLAVHFHLLTYYVMWSFGSSRGSLESNCY